MTTAFWNLVLAGGAGRRLQALTGDVPKQFWSPDGRHTMLELTVDRVLGLVPPERIVTVIGPGQGQFTSRLATPRVLGQVVAQQADRGTGIAVLTGLAAILREDEDAVVLITPADHGIGSAAEFRLGVRLAVSAVHAGREQVVLFGVVPSEAACDYGWILPAARGRTDGPAFRRVSSFVEKPPPPEAARLLTAGGLWNTMVVAARARDLVTLFETQYSGIFDAVREFLSGEGPDPRLARLPFAVPAVDFSRDILTHAKGLAVYTWPDTLDWCDLGTPERLRRWQRAS
jgi:mannose-1-phosphate guanylyltransferase